MAMTGRTGSAGSRTRPAHDPALPANPGPSAEAGLAKVAAERWRRADGLVPNAAEPGPAPFEKTAEKTAHARWGGPDAVTHAALFPPPERPSRLRLVALASAAVVALVAGGGALAMLFSAGTDSPTAVAEASASRPAPAAEPEALVAENAEPTPQAVADIPPTILPTTPSPRLVTDTAARPIDLGAESPAPAPAPAPIDATTTGTTGTPATTPAAPAGAVDSGWMDRWASEDGLQLDDAAGSADLAAALRTNAAEYAPSAATPPQLEPPAPAPADEAVGAEAPAQPGELTPETVGQEAPAPGGELTPEAVAEAAAAGRPEAIAPPADDPAAAGEDAADPATQTETAALDAGSEGQAGKATSSVNMRASPENGSSVVGVLSAGADVRILSCDYWCEVVAPDGKRGFVYKSFVSTGQ